MIRCSDPACTAPGVKRQDDVWFCLFHPGRRPNIDSHTGLIRETPAERDAREKEARRVMARANKVKVIRPVKARREIAKPDPAVVLAQYAKGMSIRLIGETHGWTRKAVSAIVTDAGLLNTRPEVDVEQVRADFLSGIPRKQVARTHRISTERVGVIVADLERPAIVGQKATPIDEDQLVALYATTRRARDVARALGVSEKRVLSVLHERGVCRPRHAFTSATHLKDTA
jgi:hypothetical protein